MLSLCVWVVVLLAALLLPAWAMAYFARRAGSPRGRFLVALGVQLLIGLVNGVLFAAAAGYAPEDEAVVLLVDVGLPLLNLLTAFVLIGWVFGLPTRRTFLPFGGFFGANLLLALVVYGVIRPFVCQSYKLPSISMAPTIERGDRFSVNKLARPRRWDLVVYHNEKQGVLYCKRLVGLPGERLRFEGGSLYVNDRPVTAPPVLAGRLRPVPADLPPGAGRYDEGETIALGPGEYFFVGDNPDRSNDSRLEGPTGADALVGVIDLFYWPPRKAGVVR